MKWIQIEKIIIIIGICSIMSCSSPPSKKDIGLATGAVAGAVIGSQFGSGAGKVLATGAGAAVGAVAGSKIGEELEKKE
jgi:uncharacterized protein YcfJ